MDAFVTTVALVGIVIIVASLLSGVLDRTGVPLVAVFLALGAALGPWGLGLVDVTLASPTLRVLATLALALVLFTDAVTLETSEVRSNRPLAWRMLLPGTLIPAGMTSLAARAFVGLDWSSSAVLGAALASTDPVILRSLLRSPSLPSTTRIALRLETGMNDVALLPVIVIAMLLAGVGAEAPALQEGARAGEATVALLRAEIGRDLLGLFLLGPVLGAAVGWVGIATLVRVRSRTGVRRDYESLYALGLAFTAFAAAESVGGSGFVAAFTAGLMVAAQDVELCDCFLEYGESTAEMLMLLTFVAFGASLIWSGVAAVSAPVLAVVAVALVGRSAVLYPMLGGLGVARRERVLIALLGPRGLSALLLVLLPVFEGMPGAGGLFSVTALTVLLSVVLHGGGIALLLRSGRRGPGPERQLVDLGIGGASPSSRELTPRGQEIVTAHVADDADVRVSIDQLRALRERGEPVTLVDVRADRSYRASEVQATGAVRIPPDDPVRAAGAARLPRDRILALYCA
jgi:NhaP-type Na+/H+ or K+/H+ antiporter